MNQNQIVAMIDQQFDAEIALIARLTEMCDQFGAMVKQVTTHSDDSVTGVVTQEADAGFAETTRQTAEGRDRIVALINEGRSDESPISLRQYIYKLPEPARTELESRRLALANRTRELHSQVTADSAVVFYTFDFYRRLFDGIANITPEEKHYGSDGKSASNATGKLVRRAC